MYSHTCGWFPVETTRGQKVPRLGVIGACEPLVFETLVLTSEQQSLLKAELPLQLL